MAQLKFHFFNEFPGEDRYAPMPWPSGINHSHAISQLQELAQNLPKADAGDPGPHLNFDKNSVPFGIGTGGYTGEAWLVLDRITSHWALLYWERSYCNAPPQFATKSLSDACNLYLAAIRPRDETSRLMMVNPDELNDYRTVYDHAYSAHPSSSGFHYTYNVSVFFKAIQKQLKVHSIFKTTASKTGELIGPHVKLIHKNGLLCMRHKTGPNACWFSTPREAISAFILANTGKFIFKSDKESVLSKAL